MNNTVKRTKKLSTMLFIILAMLVSVKVSETTNRDLYKISNLFMQANGPTRNAPKKNRPWMKRIPLDQQ